MSKEKQNRDLINTLITIAESSSETSIIPVSKTAKETVKVILFKVLKDSPYQFKQNELFHEVHIHKMGKSLSAIKLDTYKLQRSELCSLLGWGIHGDEHGKLALIPAESKEYEQLFNDPYINKKKAYKK
jgi:hypothetical protein